MAKSYRKSGTIRDSSAQYLSFLEKKLQVVVFIE